jgi:hypothetical protein
MFQDENNEKIIGKHDKKVDEWRFKMVKGKVDFINTIRMVVNSLTI